MNQLKETGLRYGDSCSVITAMKPRRRIALNRTLWDILPEADQGRSQLPLIAIPGTPARSFHWRLELVSVEGEERFLLRSVDGNPFPLNGQWGRETFLEGQDTLSLAGGGRLEFRREGILRSDLAPALPEGVADERVLQSPLSVLLQGESGTGKSYLAAEVHRHSQRTGEFVALNIAALSPGLVESELFGHCKGAFTGASFDKEGALAQAHGGTLFLDEIDSLSCELQVKLLQCLDHGKFRVVGSMRERQTTARFIFAAGRPLSKLVQQKLVRPDLYYRLSQGVIVDLRPLRENPEEVTRHCQLFALEHDLIVGQRLQEFYRSLPWPGNVRQLRGHLLAKKVRSKTRKLDFDVWDERLLTMSSDLQHLIHDDTPIRSMESVKREYARHAFHRCQGELMKAARELGVNAKTLKTWLQ